MTKSSFQRRRYLVLALTTITLTGCAGVGQGGSDGPNATCPTGPLATLIARDVSGTQASPDLDARALSVMDEQIDLAVACAAENGRGHFAVRLFATNTAQTATVISRELTISGATAIARQRKAERENLAENLKNELREHYFLAIEGLPANASDVLSQFPLALEHVEQLGQQTSTAWALSFVVLTDGLANRPDGLTDQALTVAGAEALAASTSQPWDDDFKPWSVSAIGIGRIAGDNQPSTDYIEALKAFYRAWLDGKAERVSVVTDYPTRDGQAVSTTEAQVVNQPEPTVGASESLPSARQAVPAQPTMTPKPSSAQPSPDPTASAGLEVTGMKAVGR